jgi:mono/diheme cytochrome c family protein
MSVLVLGAMAPAWAEADEGRSAATPATAAGTVDFSRDIRPIFAARCASCHGASKRRGGLRLDRKADAMAGGDSGRAIEPGKGAESLLIEYVSGAAASVMPPKGQGERLTPEQVGRLRDWIDQGAPWPDDDGAPAAGSDHWAFRPVARPEVPVLNDRSGVRNPIDAFIRAKLEAEHVAPSPEADRPTLIRRLSLDLLGLPPSPAEVESFINDESPDAYERLVDRLLASPHFGERWGRHWLDLARYADSDGYEKDSPRPNAWRYRDWVIAAINRDFPFDQFTVQQLAGDLLPGADLQVKAATGFHRNTLTNREGGVDKEEFRVAAVVDRVNTTGTVWLGLTVGCAQCHTHKYDPILHREYYGLFAFFNTANEVDIPLHTPKEVAAFERAKAAFDAETRELKQALTSYDAKGRPARQEAWEVGVFMARFPLVGLPDEVVEALATRPEHRCPVQAGALAQHHRTIDPEWNRLNTELTRRARKAPKLPDRAIPTLAENPKPPETHVLIRGDFLRKGDAVSPGTPAVLQTMPASGKVPDRLDLARWLTDPANPLTARVAVNRAWYHLFGRGLVASVDDFGTRGERPSHPKLLDWLASEFVRLGWSRKELIRTIVTSATYRQTSRTQPELHDRDPNNVWLARQNRLRLEAEVLRDVALGASGLLAPRVGGPSVRPPQPPGISELTYANSARWVESTGPDRYRRGLYTWFQRTSPYPMLMTFDAPDSNVCAVKRERSNTPLQALTLLNDAAFFECAQALGRRIASGPADGTEGRIRHAFRIGLARDPSPEELSVVAGLHDALAEQCRSHPEAAAKLVGPNPPAGADIPETAAWVALARTLLNLDEFVSRE